MLLSSSLPWQRESQLGLWWCRECCRWRQPRPLPAHGSRRSGSRSSWASHLSQPGSGYHLRPLNKVRNKAFSAGNMPQLQHHCYWLVRNWKQWLMKVITTKPKAETLKTRINAHYEFYLWPWRIQSFGSFHIWKRAVFLQRACQMSCWWELGSCEHGWISSVQRHLYQSMWHSLWE